MKITATSDGRGGFVARCAELGIEEAYAGRAHAIGAAMGAALETLAKGAKPQGTATSPSAWRIARAVAGEVLPDLPIYLRGLQALAVEARAWNGEPLTGILRNLFEIEEAP